MLEKLLKVQEVAWAGGERKLVEAILLQENPDQAIEAWDKELLLSLICNENAIRVRLGEQTTVQEYQKSFPHLHDELEVQWEINAMLGSISSESKSKSVSKSLSTAPLTVGRYSIRREIGRGAMGIVYEAFDPKLKRVVALKRLRAGCDADESELRRISSEAEAIAQLNHPNIVQLYDFEMENEIPFLVMEYCTGGTLASYMKGRPLDSKQAVELVSQVASGLAAAHAVGIVHRDLKPANIMLDGPLTLKPKVSDFGLAKRLGLDSNATATGTLIGSPAYMPPEQASGIANEADPAADIYSLGAVLYECLTGRPPFRGSSLLDTLDQVRNSEPVQVRALEPRVPRDLETIVHKCLRKRAEQRYANASEFAEDLTRFGNREPILARRESWIETGIRIFRRYPLASSLTAVTALLLVVLTISSLLFAQKFNTLLRQSQLSQAEALIGRAHGVRLSRRPGQRFEALASLSKATEIGRNLDLPKEWYETIRDETIAALMLPDVYVENWHDEPAVPFSADYSNDHLHYAVSFEDLEDIRVRELSSHVELGRIPKVDKKTRVRWVGKSSVFLQGQGNGCCELWDVANVPYKRVWRLESGCNFFNFSNDQKYLVTADPHWMRVIEVHSGTVTSKLRSSPFARDPHMALHPTKPWILCCSYTHDDMEIRNWITDDTVQVLQPDKGTTFKRNYSSAVWSPDGKTLFAIQGDGQNQHWYRFDEQTERYVLEQSDRPVKLRTWGGAIVRFNTGGDRLLVRSWTPTLEVFDAETNLPLFAGGDAIFLDPGHVPESPRIDPQEKLGSFSTSPSAPKSLGVASIAVSREAKLIIPNTGSQFPFGRVVDPTGRFLLGSMKDGLVIADARTGRPILKKKLKDFDVHCFAFDRNGSFYLAGQSGNYCCSYKVSESPPYHIEIAIPRRIHMPFGSIVIGCSDDGRTVAGSAPKGYGTQEYCGSWIKVSSEPAALKVFGGEPVSSCNVSPNGEYVVGNGETKTMLWQCSATPRLEKNMAAGTYPRFSRDGKWLLAGRTMVQMENLKPIVSFTEGVPYDLSDDGTLVAFGTNDGALGLASTFSGKTLARFSTQEEMLHPVFSPDGERLTCYSAGNGVMLIDLRAIRKSLAEKGLDWKSPAFPESDDSHATKHRIETVRVPTELESIETVDDLSDLVDRYTIRRFEENPSDADTAFSTAMVYIERRQYPQAMNLLDRACALMPASITARQWRAYLFAVMRDYDHAIQDANWVLERFENTDLRLLSAEWHYQAKQYEAAVDDCGRVIERKDYWGKFAYGLRAACYEALGNDSLAAQDQAKFADLTRHDSKSLNFAAEPMSGMDISLRHPALAFRVLQKLQSLNEELTSQVQHTVARVLYINDRYEQVVEHLESSLAKGSEQYESSNLYLLAMAKHQLGQHEAAEEVLARAEACPIPPAFDFRARRNLRILQAECKSLVH